MAETEPSAALRPLAVLSGGFLREGRLRRILHLAGWKLQIGARRSSMAVAVWGRRKFSYRGLRAAARRGLPVLNVEDAFLRSIRPGASGDLPMGLLLDLKGLHYDCAQSSTLEDMLAHDDLDDPALLARAKAGIAFLKHHGLSKYNCWEAGELPPEGFVLLVDQTRGDASITHGGANAESFTQMLTRARADHPDREIIIRAHPEVAQGRKSGHFDAADLAEGVRILTDPVNPWDLLTRAHAVYCVTSQLGFEAILAGHRPVVLGLPFYAGWGLSADAQTGSRRGRKRSAEQLFAAAMLIYPTWYDPYHDRLAQFEDVAGALVVGARIWRENARGAVCIGISRWKRRHLGAFLDGRAGAPIYQNDQVRAIEMARATGRGIVVWAGKESATLRQNCADAEVPLARMEDGFLRSVGLGARLLPAASLVVDDVGIYFDPNHPSRLEQLIAASATLDKSALERAAALRRALIESRISKYNVGSAPVPFHPKKGQRVILVPGQVEDDASIRKGAGETRTNLQLLSAVRAAEPEAFIIYKPHPDVETGLRIGAVDEADLIRLADHVARRADAAQLLDRVDAVWTITSALGFEALIRGREVHCLGTPFYAGWGLTTDHAAPCARRKAKATLDGLVHAVLIDYPRYVDPVSGLACPPEIIVERLAARVAQISRHPSIGLLTLSWLQAGLKATARLWRRA